MRIIDLNVDLGEGGAHDAELIALASSANIACGGHAGDETTMRTAVSACLEHGVAIGAHPGYEDRENFGRVPMNLAPGEVADLVSRQIERLASVSLIHHVKPHGALYNQADRDPEIAAAVVRGVHRLMPGCVIYVPPSGALAAAATAAGLIVHAEGFADRRYQENGALVPRGEVGAVIEDIGSATAQAMEIAVKQGVETVSGTWIPLPARTLCVHGDGAQAVALLRNIRSTLEAAGFTIQA